MHDFLKKLLNKKEPDITLIAFDALPGWLDDRETRAYATLTADTAGPVHTIRNAAARLQHILNGIAAAEQDPGIHPRLKTIAKNSLPLFVKAMNASLAKDLPEEPEAFYAAAVECVKGCLNSVRGQGRYLQVVFPEKMKEIRTGIDTIGREINGISAALARYRTEKALIDQSRALLAALRDIGVDAEKARAKDQRIAARVGEITDRLAAIDIELRDLYADPGMSDVENLRSTLAERERLRDEAARNYAALSMTASHVFRKAEKIAVRKRLSPEISALRQTMELLSDHTVPDTAALSRALAAAFPVTETMIAAGEVILKNKEERAVFADTGRYTDDLCRASGNIPAQEDACRNAQDALAAHPLLVSVHSLEREKEQLGSMLKKEDLAHQELAEWREKTSGKIPGLEHELAQKIAEIAGQNVQIQAGSHILA